MMRPAATSLSLAEADATASVPIASKAIAKRNLRGRAVGVLYNEGCTDFSAVSVVNDCDEIIILNAANRRRMQLKWVT